MGHGRRDGKRLDSRNHDLEPGAAAEFAAKTIQPSVIGDKTQSLHKAIHELNPGADAKGETKNAEQQAKDDLKDLGA